MKITIEQVLSWGPCDDYATEEQLLEVTGGRREMELLEALALDIHVEDRIWLGCHALPPALRSEFACDCAERALSPYERQYPGDRRLRSAIEARRAYNDGLIFYKDLVVVITNSSRASRDIGLDATWYRDPRRPPCMLLIPLHGLLWVSNLLPFARHGMLL